VFTWRRSLVAAIVVLGGLTLALWLAPSGQYLLLPDEAQPVDPLVAVEGEGADGNQGDGTQAAPGGGGIYMVDILVRKANLLERLFPRINEGADLIAEERINPQGVSEQQRRQSNRLDMTRSQEIAAAVALQHLGYDVNVQSSGAEISLVLPGSPAAQAGLQPGDVILEAEGQPVKSPDELRDAFADVQPGDQVTIAVQRSGGQKDYTLTTRASEEDPERAVIGVVVQQAASINLPIDINIDAGAIGGPSAGLAFALDIVDELGGDIDQGRRIVVTGELALDGSVQPIGGIEQKVIGAERAGADIMVVPIGNAREAQSHASDDLAIVPVATFDEALRDLNWRSGAPPPTDSGPTTG
jgi:PDZ domain-containing protein